MYVSANSGTMREAIVAFTISQKDGPQRTYIIGGEAGIVEMGTVGSTGSVLTRARGGLNVDDREVHDGVLVLGMHDGILVPEDWAQWRREEP